MKVRMVVRLRLLRPLQRLLPIGLLTASQLTAVVPAALIYSSPSLAQSTLRSGPAITHSVTAASMQFPAKYNGGCNAPAHGQAIGTITTDGPGIVWYRFELGALGYPQGQEGTLTFTRAGTMTVTRDVTFEFFSKVGFGGGGGHLSAAPQNSAGGRGMVVHSQDVRYDVECAGGPTSAGLGVETPGVVPRSTQSRQAAQTRPPAAAGNPFIPIRVHCGGGALIDADGNEWLADSGFSGGSETFSSGAGISGTKTPALYQTERWSNGNLDYAFDVPNGKYLVRLKFAEVYFRQGSERLFDVDINGRNVLRRFDVLAEAGGANRALDREFTTEVRDGKLSIHFKKVVQNPKISAIEILPASGDATPGGGAALSGPFATRARVTVGAGETPFKLEEKVAFMFVNAIVNLEGYCERHLDRPCSMAELANRPQAKDGWNMQKLKFDPTKTDPNYTYTISIRGQRWEVSAVPRKAGLGGFYNAGATNQYYYNPKGPASVSSTPLTESGIEGDSFQVD